MPPKGTDARELFRLNLARHMESRGITQADIISRLGVSSSTASDWVSGKKYPRIDSMQALADLLEVNMTDLTSPPTEPISQKRRILFDRSKDLTDSQMDIVLGVVDGFVDKNNDKL